MKTMQLWRALEALPSLAAVMAEWNALLGQEAHLIRPFLRPLPLPETTYPRCDGGDPDVVVKHADGTFVAVSSETGETTPLSERQLVVYELDHRRFGEQLARAYGVNTEGALQFVESSAMLLGDFVASSKSRYAAFLLLPFEVGQIKAAVNSLIAVRQSPFVLFVPTRRLLEPAVATTARNHGSVLVVLAETLAFAGPGSFVPTESLEFVIARDKSEISKSLNRNTFKKEGNRWRIAFAGKKIDPEHQIGFTYIAHLISKKRVPVHATVLLADAKDGPQFKPISGSEILDQQTRSECRERYEELERDLEKAKANNDFGLQESTQTEMDSISDKVRAAVGLGGHSRIMGSDSEKARKSVGNAISRAITAIRKAKHADLASHFDNCIQAGHALCYEPETDLDWDL